MSSSSKSSGATATQPTTSKQVTQTAQAGHVSVPHDKIAMRAYAKWQQRGCPCGTEKQDWQEAEAELKAEMTRGNSAPAAPAKQGARR